MKPLFFVLSLLISVSASAAYDATWYQTDFWSGEYPAGFSVVKKGITVPARTQMDKDLKTSLVCPVDYKGVYHPWNPKQRATFTTFSKIVPLIVKEDADILVYGIDSEVKIPMKKGDVIEFLVYGGEGWFTVRINGENYDADQGLFEQVEPVDQSVFLYDQWLEIDCVGKKAYVLFEDLYTVDGDGNEKFINGLDSWFLGFRDYGSVTDLSNKDLRKSK